MTSNPIIRGNTVYLQDSSSSVYALDVESGALRWKHTFDAPNDGPNGLAISGSRVYGATDTTALALDAETGRLLWSRRLASRNEQFVGIAPIVDRGRVYVSTQGFTPGGRGVLYALSATTGKIVWRFQTIKVPWPHPESSGGGGAWYAVSIDERGNVYAGIANPGPWGGSKASPNGRSFPGPALYTDSLVVLAGATGKLLWYDQVTAHDVRDYDLQLSPIIASVGSRHVVFGAGKGGRVVAWDRADHSRIWSKAVGTHLHDLGPLPSQPHVYARATRWRPHADGICRRPAVRPGGGALLAGERGHLEERVCEITRAREGIRVRPRCVKRETHLAAAARLGAVRLRNGCTRRRHRSHLRRARRRAFGRRRPHALAYATPAGNNSCPAVGKDVLVIAAGAKHPRIAHPIAEVVAYSPER